MDENLNFYPEELNYDRETGKFSKPEKKEDAASAPNFSNPLIQNLLKENPMLQNFKSMSKEDLLMQAFSSSFKKNQNIEKKTTKNEKLSDFFEEF